MVQWLDLKLFHVDCDVADDSGRVTIHRLNRTEYTNTIRDLLLVDVDVADEFPSDDVGYGFSNIADVLSLPPLLLEKYVDASEQIAAVVQDQIDRTRVRHGAGIRGQRPCQHVGATIAVEIAVLSQRESQKVTSRLAQPGNALGAIERGQIDGCSRPVRAPVDHVELATIATSLMCADQQVVDGVSVDIPG